MTFRRCLTRLWLILLVALLLRIGYAVDYQHGKPEQALGAISFLYEPGNIAYSLATHHGFASPFRSDTGPTAWMTPVYPLVLAAIFRLFGLYTYHAFLVAIAFNILCSALTCIPIYKIGREVESDALGALAAWFWAIFPNAIIIPTRDLWDASIAALLSAVILWATITTSRSRRWNAWIAYGCLWGLALMTTPTLGSFLPFLLIWMTLRAYRPAREGVCKAGIILAIAILICVPWTVRNYRAFRAFVPLRSVMGLQLWMGNNETSGRQWPGLLHPIANSTERRHYVEVGEMRYMAEKRAEGLAFIVNHPREELSLTARRFVATWSGGDETPIRNFFRNHSFYFRSILLANIAAALGCLIGAILLIVRRHPLAFPIVVIPAVFPLISYITLASPRYRHPIDPIILLLCAVSVYACYKRGRSTVFPSV
ncbi:MAG TPA: glycosyltransferase family 39 protein [Bryobacteraceae bacterium]|nr:glycosyltransferase family 39 protein [Bryobacteraceae bacterium]